ncbi:MAG TPA: inorganic diphosphatase, partial [Candidatus Berkiella sp.]|nr:inorganic diphosphatase [Candidatus Berkiella sp.]
MGLARVSSGRHIPDDINVIIEIPAHSEPIKYEVDKDTGSLFVDRFLSTSMYYPCDYGYIPQTLSDDGDPVDVLVITPIPVNHGCVIRCRPVGILSMRDEAGDDLKILAVPINKLTPLYNHVQEPEDLPPLLINRITHFFAHYKDLEEGKWVTLNGWLGADEAKKEILAGVKRYHDSLSE